MSLSGNTRGGREQRNSERKNEPLDRTQRNPRSHGHQHPKPKYERPQDSPTLVLKLALSEASYALGRQILRARVPFALHSKGVNKTLRMMLCSDDSCDLYYRTRSGSELIPFYLNVCLNVCLKRCLWSKKEVFDLQTRFEDSERLDLDMILTLGRDGVVETAPPPLRLFVLTVPGRLQCRTSEGCDFEF